MNVPRPKGAKGAQGAEGWWGADGHWREPFELAWESLAVGSPPVGAVVAGPDGAIVARGRSRRAEPSAPPNQLAGSRLAHAEVNALAQLPVERHAGHVLYVTLEPCFLCLPAVAASRVPVVRYAGPDPTWRSVREVLGAQAALQYRWPALHGPLAGPLGVWGTLLPLVERLERDPAGPRVDAFRSSHPGLVALAERVVREGVLRDLAGGPLDDALAALWPELLGVAGPPG